MAKRWYVVHVFSGFEKKMKQAILEQAVSNSLEDMIEDVLVPTEEYVEMRRGAKVQAERKFFPGYILVKMELSDATWSLVQSQTRVTGCLGGTGKPVHITNAEAERVLRQMDEGVERPVAT
ncbi:MAG: transcription termination/antitermination protein NusG, partial [Alphaproteobacteria bacterium]|nr:transcription termination/antitermination protein NusG [Alphaproteobacteria bacterium]